ncbi:U-box domain-containing protein 35-like [Humulus lupulus]|uniref:U-box domain-containing protein 35-like n=1 Tax=Humulus lupulus TaxID=3486 RepID=UPI002B415B87|nr:U-box domain-containing protein 35-like [Humulus lupulus]
MWATKRHELKKGSGNGLIAVAIDKDKGSQAALKWTAENILSKGQVVVLIHVVQKQNSQAPSVGGSHAIICDFNSPAGSPHKQLLEKQTRDLFVTFHCFCTRKDIQCLDIILEDSDVGKAISEYISYAAIENMIMGSPSKHGFMRFKGSSIPSIVSKVAPDFCTVYVISKGKVSSVRNSSRPAPYSSPLLSHIQNLTATKEVLKPVETPKPRLSGVRAADRQSFKPRSLQEDHTIRSPFARRRNLNSIYNAGAFYESDTDISFVSSDRPSTDRPSSVFYDYIDPGRNSRVSTSSDNSFGSFRPGPKFCDLSSLHDVSTISLESDMTGCSFSSQGLDEVETEMRRLKLELKQTMDMYSAACREALTAKQKEKELHHWRLEEEQKLEEARLAEEAALALAEKEKVRCRAAMESAEAAKRIAELETQKRASAEVISLREVKEMRRLLDNLAQTDGRYRRYTIEEIELATDYFAESRKIGEGGYGPVFKCYLDHTPVAVKVLRPDAAQGRSQFQQEIDILSCIRHPNMVLLLGACPEYGILVYEYMGKGSLDDCLFPKGKTPAMPWQVRFRIAAEIATGLLFLHQTKPEPLVHRDLKPGNILLDYNYVSKISDVGLARLVPAVAENVTQYHITSTAGTFCYIDPEYQQTGMLGVKSDVYSLGIMLLQLITAKPPMGLAHFMGNSIERGTFPEMLDPAVTDWPMEETLSFAKLALQCAELRRKDRPDLCNEVLPHLNKLREFAEENMNFYSGGTGLVPYQNPASIHQEVMSDPFPRSTSSSVTGTPSSTE